MTDPLPAMPAPLDRALAQLERVRTAISEGNLDEAVDELKALDTLVSDWQRSENRQAARRWIDAALRDDLLVFNVEVARQHLARWEAGLEDDEDGEFKQIRERVETRSKEKQATLQIRGVIAHCEELFASAGALEISNDPPHPDFMLTNYYNKARSIAAAAQGDNDDNAELDRLLQKAERLRMNRVTASRVYPAALEEARYADALRDLDKLPADGRVPRYETSQDDEGQPYTMFHSMVTVPEATKEVEALAQDWAVKKAQDSLKAAETQLDRHQPQAALDTLTGWEAIEAFLTAQIHQLLDEMQQRISAELEKLQQAEDQAAQVRQLAKDDAISAWNLYAEGYSQYQWAPSLDSARAAAVSALRTQLDSLIQQTEQAFSDKQMEHVQQLYRQGQRTYGDKDVILDDLLARLAELNEMTHQYEEYLHSTADTVRQVRDMIEKDAAAAGELLAQLDGYPEMVLESFPDLHDLRDKVNHRLEADHAYTRLYHLLFATEQAEVQQAVEMAGHAVTTYDDDRFSALTQALQHHLDFLKGQQEQAAGQTVRALEHLKAVAAADNHPDQEAAIKLIAALSDTSND